jgi:hypothetical protein
MSKFNKFETLLETAFSHYSNGGFREGAPVRLKPSFLNSPYFKQHYGNDTIFSEWIKSLMDRQYFFFIKRVVGHGSMQDVKDANDNSGAGDCFLLLKMDPRTVSAPTEVSEFTVPGDMNHIEVLHFGTNLPPVQGVPNPYEYYKATLPELASNQDMYNTHPQDDELPKKNTSFPASTAKAAKFKAPKKLKLSKRND